MNHTRQDVMSTVLNLFPTRSAKTVLELLDIEIPSGFFRHPASRYVVMEIGRQLPHLVAKTWFKQEDMVYYLEHLAPGRTFRLLDFKERQELHLRDGQLLRVEGTLHNWADKP